MFMAIFDFDINLLLESVIYVSCMFVHVHAYGELKGERAGAQVVAHMCVL